MDDPKDSPLRKAEESAKRALERLGSAIDKKVLGRTSSEFGVDYAGELASRIERSIESSLKPDSAGKPTVAPNHFKVGLTYEEASKLTPRQLESLARDLQAAAHEFIHNRRYQTQGPIQVEVVSDLFASSAIIKADHAPGQAAGSDPSGPSVTAGPTNLGDSVKADSAFQKRAGSATTPGAAGPTIAPPGSGTDRQRISLVADDGRAYPLDLIRGGAPACVGRVAGNAVRLDDPSVSRVHCSIALRGDGQIVISDLESANGTFVNGQVVNTGEALKLEPGDDIRVGEVALKVGTLES
jgi:hypothetical protein